FRNVHFAANNIDIHGNPPELRSEWAATFRPVLRVGGSPPSHEVRGVPAALWSLNYEASD
ncbi:MAG: hypothetical protein E7C78_07140, partial [Dermabacter sp.]|nr:hypothetical protein [Dermabacter sp.]